MMTFRPLRRPMVSEYHTERGFLARPLWPYLRTKVGMVLFMANCTFPSQVMTVPI